MPWDVTADITQDFHFLEVHSMPDRAAEHVNACALAVDIQFPAPEPASALSSMLDDVQLQQTLTDPALPQPCNACSAFADRPASVLPCPTQHALPCPSWAQTVLPSPGVPAHRTPPCLAQPNQSSGPLCSE
jgi:hypothetical protein